MDIIWWLIWCFNLNNMVLIRLYVELKELILKLQQLTHHPDCKNSSSEPSVTNISTSNCKRPLKDLFMWLWLVQTTEQPDPKSALLIYGVPWMDCRWGHYEKRKHYLSAWGLELWIGQSLMSTEGLKRLSHLWFSPSGITSNEVSNAVYYAGRQFSQQEWRCSSPGVAACHGNSPLLMPVCAITDI